VPEDYQSVEDAFLLASSSQKAADRRRKKHGAKQQGSLQLDLFADEPIPRDAERPLFDLIPEAYD
jgi:hypothetical protein